MLGAPYWGALQHPKPLSRPVPPQRGGEPAVKISEKCPLTAGRAVRQRLFIWQNQSEQEAEAAEWGGITTTLRWGSWWDGVTM